MFGIIATLFLWAGILLLTEFLWKRKVVRGEYARKMTHILISVSIATTPYYLEWYQIQLIGLVGLGFTALFRFSQLFKSTYDIQRKSWGEIIGPASIIILAFFEPPAIVFVAVMLNTGVADGVAAIMGTRYGKNNSYKVFGYTKSLVGTGSFFVTSLLATIGIVLLSDVGTVTELLPLILLVPSATTVIENVGVYGIDNALITASTVAVYYVFI